MKRLMAISFALGILAWAPSLVSQQDAALQDLLNASSLWTREYLLTLSDNLPTQASQAFEKKLLTHQAELSSRLEPFYGTKVSQDLAELLKAQGTLLIELITAAKQGDSKKQDETNQTLQLNATSISSQLSKVNPYINFCTIRDMLFDYLALISRMITDRITTKWHEDIDNYDKVRAKNNQIASYITQAMTNAFPSKEVVKNGCPAPQLTRATFTQSR